MNEELVKDNLNITNGHYNVDCINTKIYFGLVAIILLEFFGILCYCNMVF